VCYDTFNINKSKKNNKYYLNLNIILEFFEIIDDNLPENINMIVNNNIEKINKVVNTYKKINKINLDEINSNNVKNNIYNQIKKSIY
jgi:mannose/fructose/N-acetylgalactosamine-specific phosphotransferase system component IIB